MKTTPQELLPAGAVRPLIAGIAVGVIGFVVALVNNPPDAWAALLCSAFLFLTVSLGAVVFLCLGHVSGAGWHIVVKRVAEALGGWLPFGAASMLVLFLGVSSLYHWADHGHGPPDPILEAKSAWLNVPFFVGRGVAVLLVWILLVRALRRASQQQDQDGSLTHTRRSVALAAVFLVVIGVTFSMASFDWLMSLEPHWYSTIFGFYNITGLLTAGVAGIIVVSVHLHQRGLLPQLNESHLHDLGKYLFAFSTLWAYHWLSQFLLIWYADMPEETVAYSVRFGGGWAFLFWLNIIAGWAIPFLVLLPRAAKRSAGHLFRVALWMLAARWLDIYMQIAPSTGALHRGINVADVLVLIGFTCAFLLVLFRNLGSAPLLAKRDPYMIESLHHQV